MMLFAAGALIIAFLILSGIFTQGVLYSGVLQIYAQTSNSTFTNSTDSSIPEITGNATSPSNDTGLQESELPSIPAEEPVNGTGDNAISAVNASNLLPDPTSGIITIVEKGIDNTTEASPSALSLSVSGRYSYDPLLGLTVNETAGQLLVEHAGSQQDTSNNGTGASGNQTTVGNVTIMTTLFNLTNAQLSISNDSREVTINSEVIGFTDGFTDIIGNIEASLVFDHPLDFSSSQILNATNSSTLRGSLGSQQYQTTGSTTTGRLSLYIDTFSAVKQEFQSLNTTEQIAEELSQENSTLAEQTQELIFQSLNVTVPEAPDGTAEPVLESKVKPLLRDATEQEVQSLTPAQRDLYDFILASLQDTDLTDEQQNQLDALVQQVSNTTEVSGESRISKIVDGIAAVLIASLPAASENATSAIVNTSFQVGGTYTDSSLLYPSQTAGIRNAEITPVFLGALLSLILPVLVDFIFDALKDKIPPTIIPPGGIVEPATGSCTYVDLYKNGYPYVHDNRDSSPTLSNDAPPCFQLGTIYVTWTAVDDSGNFASAQQAVTIEETLTKSFSVWQSGIAGATTVADAPADCSDVQVSDVWASGDDGNVPTNTLDGSLTTRWSGFGIGSWIIHDTGDNNVICDVEIAWYQGDRRTNDFTISVSENGADFTTVYSDVSSGTTRSHELYDIPDTIARYVKVTVYGNTINDWASITEVNLLGQEAAATHYVVLDITGTYEYSDVDRSVTINQRDIRGLLTIYESETGQTIEQLDLSSVSVMPTQQDQKITLYAYVDSPVMFGSVTSAMKFIDQIDFKYGGYFASTDFGNVLMADTGDAMYDTDVTSIGSLYIDIPLTAVLIQEAQ